jgi:hypothetical protein
MTPLSKSETVAVLNACANAPVDNVDRRQVEHGFRAGIQHRDEQVEEAIHELVVEQMFTPENLRRRLKEKRNA